jgi:hypothetical protein
MAPPLVELRDVSKRYAGVQALAGIGMTMSSVGIN